MARHELGPRASARSTCASCARFDSAQLPVGARHANDPSPIVYCSPPLPSSALTTSRNALYSSGVKKARPVRNCPRLFALSPQESHRSPSRSRATDRLGPRIARTTVRRPDLPSRRTRRPRPAARPWSRRLTGTSIFLPLSVRGIAGTATISSGTWRGESCARIAVLIRAFSASSSSTPSAQDHEQRHTVPAVRQLEPDDQAVADLGEALDDAVQLARAEPDALAIEGRVRAALDDRAAPRGDPDPVAVAPDARVHLEVALAVAAARPGRSRSRPASTASAR